MKFLVYFFTALLITVSSQATELKLTEENTFSLRGPIDFYTFFQFQFDVVRLNALKSKEPIYLFVDSPGGEVNASELIIQLGRSSTRPIHTISAMAASAAFNIVQALGTRYINSASHLLTHTASTSIRFTEDMLKEVAAGMNYLEKIYERNALRMKLDIGTYRDLMSQEVWVRGKNNLILGSADEMVEVSCTKGLILQGNCPY